MCRKTFSQAFGCAFCVSPAIRKQKKNVFKLHLTLSSLHSTTTLKKQISFVAEKKLRPQQTNFYLIFCRYVNQFLLVETLRCAVKSQSQTMTH